MMNHGNAAKWGIWMLAMIAIAPGAFAADEDAADATMDRLMLGYLLVFILLVGYLIVSQRRNARLRDDIEFLKRRVDEL